MTTWPLKGEGPCACRFVRREEFGECEQVEWCGLHSKQRAELDLMRADAERYRWLRDQPSYPVWKGVATCPPDKRDSVIDDMRNAAAGNDKKCST